MLVLSGRDVQLTVIALMMIAVVWFSALALFDGPQTYALEWNYRSLRGMQTRDTGNTARRCRLGLDVSELEPMDAAHVDTTIPRAVLRP